MKPRPNPAGALVRPAMPAAPAAVPVPAPKTKRLTVDVDLDRYDALRQWSTDARLPASLLVRALLDLAGESTRIRLEAEANARAIADQRRVSTSAGS